MTEVRISDRKIYLSPVIDLFDRACPSRRRGEHNCLGNSIAEILFSHLEEELFHHSRFDTIEDFTAQGPVPGPTPSAA